MTVKTRSKAVGASPIIVYGATAVSVAVVAADRRPARCREHRRSRIAHRIYRRSSTERADRHHCSRNSGQSGSKINRRNFGKTVVMVAQNFPFFMA